MINTIELRLIGPIEGHFICIVRITFDLKVAAYEFLVGATVNLKLDVFTVNDIPVGLYIDESVVNDLSRIHGVHDMHGRFPNLIYNVIGFESSYTTLKHEIANEKTGTSYCIFLYLSNETRVIPFLN